MIRGSDELVGSNVESSISLLSISPHLNHFVNP